MLVPLTDSTNPYAAMMLELINSQKIGAHSHIWDAPRQPKSPRRGPLSIFGRVFGRRGQTLVNAGAASAA